MENETASSLDMGRIFWKRENNQLVHESYCSLTTYVLRFTRSVANRVPISEPEAYSSVGVENGLLKP